MAKRHQTPATRASGRCSEKRKLTRLRRSLLALAVIGAAFFVGERLGFVRVAWDEVQNRGASIVKTCASMFYRPMKPAVEPVNGDWYTLYFTTPRYPDQPSTRVHVIEEGLIAAIRSAQRSLDIAIYELNLDSIGDAILAAHDRGVAVRMVTDSDSLAEDGTLQRLQRAGVRIVPDERRAIMHNKFVVIDTQAVWTGSWNFTENDTFRNNNNAILIRSETVAKAYADEFAEMFSRRQFGPNSPRSPVQSPIQAGDALIEVCFAPEDQCGQRLIALVTQAQQTIRFLAFSFAHDGIGNAVRQQAKAGVTVQGVFETSGSDAAHSEYTLMRRAKSDVLQDGNPYNLHHKVFIIDERIVVTGSFNFSNNADRSNDENLLVIHNPEIAQAFLAEFWRMYQEARES